MRSILLLALILFTCVISYSQNSATGNIDPYEIRYFKGNEYNPQIQQSIRANQPWQSFQQSHGIWYAHFDEISGMPHRGYGKPFSISGTTLQEKALLFAEQHLSGFHIPVESLQAIPNELKGKYSYANFRQYYNGLEVVDSRFMVKFFEEKIAAFGCDVFPLIELNTTPEISNDQAKTAAAFGIDNTIISVASNPELFILPIPNNGQYDFHLVYKVMVKTKSTAGIPANYDTYVDALTGLVLSRRNTVSHAHNHPHQGKPAKTETAPENMIQVLASVTGQVYQNNPFETAVTEGFENIYITVSGTNYQADENGDATVPENPGSSANVRIMGPWSRIYTNGVTPSMNVTLVDGQNNISLDGVSNIKERSAYRSVQKIHDFMKFWMPSAFTGMDFQLPTNIDEAGECNAFYDGASINFYDIGGGCNATSLVADVCFHEYGHGINDNYYQSLGGNWVNGAMGEGYADFWALSYSNTPLLGVGFNTDNQDPLRRYDQDPKIYPSDISGEVHSDGEIIMGAWWDTHLLMGSDWNITMPLFVETYAGMQAEAANGNEGVAYTDVLIDLLQADDDDGDISNGTPHGDAIVEGFYIHGITLISNATLSHTPDLFANVNEVMTIEATLDLNFPFTQYLQSVNCFYRINSGSYNMLPMIDEGNDNYSAQISLQPAATVVAYYFGAYDLNESLSAVIPIGAHLAPFPNLPYFTLVGVQSVGIQDSDDNQDFGVWQTGIPGDNATTGEWEEDAPIGSFTTTSAPGTMVQTEVQQTPGGEFCFFTGNAANASAGIGDSDVDGGKTTLQTPTINMSSYLDPVIAYWRYYTNSPPGGANPGLDYWQVRISNDAGANWTYVENTTTSDMSWRRNAFRVADYVAPTAQMRMQFIASDSTQLGTNLDGGSLVEAAVDDFILYDALTIGVDEKIDNNPLIAVYPNPAIDQVKIKMNLIKGGNTTVRLINQVGQVVYNSNLVVSAGERVYSLNLPELAQGVYTISIVGNDFNSVETLVIGK